MQCAPSLPMAKRMGVALALALLAVAAGGADAAVRVCGQKNITETEQQQVGACPTCSFHQQLLVAPSVRSVRSVTPPAVACRRCICASTCVVLERMHAPSYRPRCHNC